MINITENDISLEEWVNKMANTYEFGIVYSVLMPAYQKVTKSIGKEIESFRHIQYTIEDENKKADGTWKPEVWDVYDTRWLKLVTGAKRRYNMLFNKLNGVSLRFGRSFDEKDDPTWCGLGPELLDLEVSVNGCPKIGGENCRFCYKGNTDAPPTNMTFDNFKVIVSRFPKTLCQIPLGITGLKTNPDLEHMLRHIQDELLIPPTLTLSGKDLDDHMANVIAECCSGCAVSCYEGHKDMCYQAVELLHSKRNGLHVNMHLVLGDVTMGHCMDVLKDVADGVVPSCRNVVFLTMKPKGRAAALDCSLSLDNIRKVVQFCKEYQIKFGFDTCHVDDIRRVLDEKGAANPEVFCERCESSRFSSYVNVRGEYHHCSFAEGMVPNPTVISSLDGVCGFIDWWRNGKDIIALRNPENPASRGCQFFKTTVDANRGYHVELP